MTFEDIVEATKTWEHAEAEREKETCRERKEAGREGIEGSRAGEGES